MSKETNYPHTGILCDTCNNSEHTVYDPQTGETYCLQCGTVIIDNNIFRITQYLECKREHDIYIRDLWKKERQS